MTEILAFSAFAKAPRPATLPRLLGLRAREATISADGRLSTNLPIATHAHKGPSGYRFAYEDNLLDAYLTDLPFLPRVLIKLKPWALWNYGPARLEKHCAWILDSFFAGKPVVRVSRFAVAAYYVFPGSRFTGLGIPAREDIMTKSRKHTPGPGTGGYGSPSGGLTWNLSIAYSSHERTLNTSQNQLPPIYRLEVKFYRPLLRQLKVGRQGSGIETLTDLETSLGDLLRVAFGDQDHDPWVRFASPGSRNLPPGERLDAYWWALLRRDVLAGRPSSGRSRTITKASSQHQTNFFSTLPERWVAAKSYAGAAFQGLLGA